MNEFVIPQQGQCANCMRVGSVYVVGFMALRQAAPEQKLQLVMWPTDIGRVKEHNMICACDVLVDEPHDGWSWQCYRVTHFDRITNILEVQ